MRQVLRGRGAAGRARRRRLRPPPGRRTRRDRAAARRGHRGRLRGLLVHSHRCRVGVNGCAPRQSAVRYYGSVEDRAKGLGAARGSPRYGRLRPAGKGVRHRPTNATSRSSLCAGGAHGAHPARAGRSRSSRSCEPRRRSARQAARPPPSRPRRSHASSSERHLTRTRISSRLPGGSPRGGGARACARCRAVVLNQR